MKPGDLIRTTYSDARAFPVFRGAEMGVIIEATEHNFAVLFTSGKVDHRTVGYYRNYYEVVE